MVTIKWTWREIEHDVRSFWALKRWKEAWTFATLCRLVPGLLLLHGCDTCLRLIWNWGTLQVLDLHLHVKSTTSLSHILGNQLRNYISENISYYDISYSHKKLHSTNDTIAHTWTRYPHTVSENGCWWLSSGKVTVCYGKSPSLIGK
jgi:hypothetical protein